MLRRAVVSLAALALLAGCGPASPQSLDDGSPTDGARGEAPAGVVLTPTEDPSTSQTFTWRSPHASADQRVVLRAEGEPHELVATARRKDATTVRDSGSDLPAWTATAEGLEPGTTYTYRVRTADGATAPQRFTTADGAIGEWSFLALGDTQVDNAGPPANIVRAAVAERPGASLVLQAGDLVDLPQRHDQWLDAFTALAPVRTTRNVVSSIGNHEQCVMVRRCRHGDAEGFRAWFTFPDNGYPEQRPTWFRFDQQGVRFVVLDSFADDVDTQAAFLEESLATSDQRWSVVLLHAGPISSRTKRTNAVVHSRILPVLERHDVDLVLTGHDHVYSRGHVGDPDGPVFATSDSGPKFYRVDDADWRRRDATRVVAAEDVSTFQTVDVGEDTLRYRAVVAHRGDGPNPDLPEGSVLDEVVITKTAQGRKTVRW